MRCYLLYLDPRKPGNFTYEGFEFKYEPIYIGKGTKDRIKRHLSRYKTSRTHFHNKLGLIIKEGYNPLYIILINNLSELDANEKEISLIKLIGREIKFNRWWRITKWTDS